MKQEKYNITCLWFIDYLDRIVKLLNRPLLRLTIKAAAIAADIAEETIERPLYFLSILSKGDRVGKYRSMKKREIRLGGNGKKNEKEENFRHEKERVIRGKFSPTHSLNRYSQPRPPNCKRHFCLD
ncbi:hypothetical protein V6Z11_D06G167600 [Gossypium hirsutum]